MEKKDLIFLATSVIVAERVSKALPPSPEDRDQSQNEFFTKWYQFLSAKYEELQ